LVQQLVADDGRSIVSVVAPAGYGKTTLLSQWAERDERPFAWVSVGDRDDDAKVLLAYVAEALDRVDPIDGSVFDALTSPVSSVPGSVVPRLAAALAAMSSPFVLVLDDVHLVHNSECRAALSMLAEEVPTGSHMVLAGRDAPPVRVARLRAEGRLTEIGAAELSLDLEETSALLQAAEVTLVADDVAALHARAEGWPVGLYLAALYLREGGSVESAAASFGGDDRVVSEYLESEFLSQISAEDRAFLTRSAALERMSGPLCEAVLDLPGAAATLADLAGSNMLFVPLDRRSQWYRYHHWFGDMLRAELERRDPEVMRAVQLRAASWSLANDQPEQAVEYSMAAKDVETAVSLIEQLWLSMFWSGQRDTLERQRDTLERWVRWVDVQGAVRAHPMIAVIASLLCSVTERADGAMEWMDRLRQWQDDEPGWVGDRRTEAFTAYLRALHCGHGFEQMRLDLDEAEEKFTAEDLFMTPSTTLCRGLAAVLAGEPERAGELFQASVALTDRPEIVVPALYQLFLFAIRRGDWPEAAALADRTVAAATRTGAEEVFVWAARAQVAAHRHDSSTARAALLRAQQLRPMTCYEVPHLAVQLRLALARVYLSVADVSGARTVMRETYDVLQRCPGLGALVDEVAEMRSLLAKDLGPSTVGPSALSAAELRVLPMLCTHLTVKEIAAELFVSRNTVSTQMQSIYRKLGANSRSQAVSRARELHLVE
jgi:LuxR family transcriptional regulator, maltose regulon positive regulatory protein